MWYRASQRAFAAVGVIIVVSVIVFGAIRAIPGDPITNLIGPLGVANPQAVAHLRSEYGLDKPFFIQYVDWVKHITVGDFGRSVIDSQPVSSILTEHIRATAILSAAAVVIAIVGGLGLGVVTAYSTGPIKGVLRAAPAWFLVIPSFSVGLGLAYVFSIRFRILPPSGEHSIVGPSGFIDLLRHLILPAFSLALLPAAIVARVTAAAIDELTTQDFVRTARAVGIPERRVAARHILPNALLPVVTYGGILISYMITNAVLVENVFSWPGIGNMMVTAIHQRDYPVVEGGALFVAATFVVMGLIVELLYGVIDPRIGSSRANPAGA